MAFQVYKEPLYRRYYADWCSLACVYTLFFLFLLIFLPLIISYNTASFWLKESTYYEQPQVDYTYNVMLQFNTQQSGADSILFWSTSRDINQIYHNYLRIPTIQSAEFDHNRDGINDRIEVNVYLPLQADEKVKSFDMLIFHEVTLKERAKYKFDTLTYISQSQQEQINLYYYDGNLQLEQKNPFTVRGGYQVLYNEDPLFPSLQNSPHLHALTVEDVSFSKVLQSYASRNGERLFLCCY